MTPAQYAINAALIRKGAEIEVDLDASNAKPSPLQFVLHKARLEAIDSCEKLIFCDPSDTTMVQQLQNEVRLFIDLVAFSKQIMDEADQAEAEMTPEDRQIVSDLVFRSNSTGDT